MTPEPTPCTTYYPDTYHARCSRCLVPIGDHNGGRTPDLALTALSMYLLLTHYGHHCTVQNYLPDLHAALVAAGVITPDGRQP